MARVITLTNGTSSVSLLETDGFQLGTGGWKQRSARKKVTWSTSLFSEGRSPIISAPENVVETYKVRLTGTNHNDISDQIQTLMRLAEQATLFHEKQRYQSPVYLQVQTTNESNARYSTVTLVYGDFSSSLYDPPFDPGNEVNEFEITIEREPYWRSGAPGVLPTAIDLVSANTPSPEADATKQAFANYRGTAVISKIYSYDASTATFSSDLSASTSFSFFEVSGSTPAVGDIMYFGSDTPFFEVVFNISTKFSGTATIVDEYWNGAAWVANEADFDRGLIEQVTDGQMIFSFRGDPAWAKTTINGQNLQWLRIRITVITTWTTTPIHSGQVVYISNNPYFEIENDQIDGDVNALAMLLYEAQQYTVNDIVDNVIFGGKSRGFDNFVSRINADNNPTAWVRSFGTDTSALSYRVAPDGNAAQCTFATDQTLVERFGAELPDLDRIIDWEGLYQIFARVEQVGGSAGDVSVKFELDMNDVLNESETIALQNVGSGPEVVSFGQFSILASGVLDFEKAFGSLEFKLYAKSDNGTTPNMIFYDFIIMPVDEVNISVSSIDRSLVSQKALSVDSGILREGTIFYNHPRNDNYRVIIPFQLRSLPPKIEPRANIRFYGLLFKSDGTSYNNVGGLAQMYIHERWLHLRGSE
jgi:hypothetical protein